VGLVRLYPREVGTFTLRETILAVELELGSDDGVLAPAVHVEGGLGEDKGTGIGNGGAFVVVGHVPSGRRSNVVRIVGVTGVGRVESRNLGTTKVGLIVRVAGAVPVAREVRGDVSIKSAGVLEETAGINEGIGVSSNLIGSSESMNSIREGVDSVSVVEGLGAKNFEKCGIASKG